MRPAPRRVETTATLDPGTVHHAGAWHKDPAKGRAGMAHLSDSERVSSTPGTTTRYSPSRSNDGMAYLPKANIVRIDTHD